MGGLDGDKLPLKKKNDANCFLEKADNLGTRVDVDSTDSSETILLFGYLLRRLPRRFPVDWKMFLLFIPAGFMCLLLRDQ